MAITAIVLFLFGSSGVQQLHSYFVLVLTCIRNEQGLTIFIFAKVFDDLLGIWRYHKLHKCFSSFGIDLIVFSQG